MREGGGGGDVRKGNVKGAATALERHPAFFSSASAARACFLVLVGFGALAAALLASAFAAALAFFAAFSAALASCSSQTPVVRALLSG